jgi:hypothetical protein
MTTGASRRLSARTRSILGVLLVVAVAGIVVSTAIAFAPTITRTTHSATAESTSSFEIDASATGRSASFHNMALNPITHRLYTTNDLSAPANRIAIIDTIAKQVVAVLQVTSSDTAELNGIAVDTERNLVYVSMASTIIVINGVTNSIARTITVPAGCRVSGIAIDAVTNTIYTGGECGGIGGILALYVSTGTLRAKFPGSASQFAIDARTDTIYAIDQARGQSVTVIDGATRALKPSVRLDGYAQGLVVDPTAGALYVGISPSFEHDNAAQIAVVDTTSNRVVASIAAPQDAFNSALAVDTATHVLYLGTAGGVTPIDATTGKLGTVIPCKEVESLAVDQTSQTIFAPVLNTMFVLPTRR